MDCLNSSMWIVEIVRVLPLKNCYGFLVLHVWQWSCVMCIAYADTFKCDSLCSMYMCACVRKLKICEQIKQKTLKLVQIHRLASKHQRIIWSTNSTSSRGFNLETATFINKSNFNCFRSCLYFYFFFTLMANWIKIGQLLMKKFRHTINLLRPIEVDCLFEWDGVSWFANKQFNGIMAK